MKTVFITGTSSGLGEAAVELFHNKGWNVIATMRDNRSGNLFAHLDRVTVLPLDITDPDQIRTVVSTVTSQGEVDVVLNNAAYGFLGAMEAVTGQELMGQINTNLLGAIRVTQAFIPHFRTRRSGLFINITSSSGLLTIPFASLYHAAKFGLEGWSEGMSYELGLFGVRIKTIAPGGIRSGFQSSMQISRAAAYQPTLDKFVQMVISPQVAANYSTPEEIAAVIYEAATDNKDQVHYLAGKDAVAMVARRAEVGPEVFRKEIAALFGLS
jgi:NAD(P)-dependent dehydrogenase (short-subunit alcohol dehydrogenase family)